MSHRVKSVTPSSKRRSVVNTKNVPHLRIQGLSRPEIENDLSDYFQVIPGKKDRLPFPLFIGNDALSREILSQIDQVYSPEAMRGLCLGTLGYEIASVIKSPGFGAHGDYDAHYKNCALGIVRQHFEAQSEPLGFRPINLGHLGFRCAVDLTIDNIEKECKEFNFSINDFIGALIWALRDDSVLKFKDDPKRKNYRKREDWPDPSRDDSSEQPLARDGSGKADGQKCDAAQEVVKRQPTADRTWHGTERQIWSPLTGKPKLDTQIGARVAKAHFEAWKAAVAETSSTKSEALDVAIRLQTEFLRAVKDGDDPCEAMCDFLAAINFPQ